MTTNTAVITGMAGSYNENSSTQLAAVNSLIPYIHEAINQLDISPSSSPLIIADFGSSHSKNSIQAMKIIIQYLQKTNKLSTSPLVIHNDLPTNDWITLFQLLQQDNSYQGVANGHSFYEQCLPSNCLSIGFSSTSLHWLSKIPSNISNNRFYMADKESKREAFKQQAKLDLSSFIENRSRELVPGGILILNIPSVNDQSINRLIFIFDLLYTCAKLLFNTKELLNFTVPIYLRALSECIDEALFDRCSLQLIKAELYEIKIPLVEQYKTGQLTFDQYIKLTTKYMQGGTELLVRRALETNERSNEEIDKLLIKFWILYEEGLREKSHIRFTDAPFVNVILILKKNESD